MNLQLLENKDNNFLTSLNPENIEEKKKLFNCINSPDYKISDCVGETIKVTNYVAHSVIINSDRGEDTEATRLVLIDEEGKTYATVSTGIIQALSKIFSIFGTPSEWDEPMSLKVVEKKSSKFKFITFEIV